MPIYGDKLTFKEPTADQVPLNAQLVAVIRQHHQKSREHLFHLCMIAYGLRRHNLISNRGKRGGNAQGKEFKPQFKAWYEKNRLEEVYGTLGNFTHYAMGGRLLSYVAWQIDSKYIDRLPSSVTGLYACSQLLWDQGDSTTQAKRNCFHILLTKRIKDGSGVFTTKINKHSTRKEIEALKPIDEKRTSSAEVKTSTKSKISNLVELGIIKVSNDLFYLTTTGTKRGHLKLEEVEKLHQAIRELIEKHDKGRNHYSFQSNLADLKKQYKAEQNYDFGASILEADTRRKRSTRKAAAKQATKR
jgi:hypothetical protein